MSSRYDGSRQLVYVSPSGARVHYLAARILPQGSAAAGGGSTPVEPGERHRLDLVAQRTLANPELSWRIADANDAMDPFELCARPGRTVLKLPKRSL